MTEIAEPGLLAIALAIEPGVRIGRRSVGIVAPLLPLEVARRTGAGSGPLVLRPEALLPGPGLDERAVDAEVLIRKELRGLGLGEHRGEECPGDIAREQPLAVLGEHGHIPDRVVGVEPDEPAEEQVVVERLHQQPLRADRVQDLEDQRPEQHLGGDRGSAELRVQPAEEWIELQQGLVDHRPDRAERMVLRDPSLRGQIAPHRTLLAIVAAHLAPPF